MSFRVRPLLALLAVAVLNLGTLDLWGFYSLEAFCATATALGLGVAACLVKPEPIVVRAGRIDAVRWLLAAITIVASIFAGFSSKVWYIDNAGAFNDLVETSHFFTYWTIALAAFIAVLNPKPMRSAWILVAMLLLSSIFICRLVIRTSPEPVIDVFCLLRDSADYVIAGKNPYANDIQSPYGTHRAEKFEQELAPEARPAGYPPLPLLLSVPPRLFGGDIRWSNIAGQIVAAGALVFVAWRRGQIWIGTLAAALYLVMPRNTFIIEQAWYEPMIAALLGIGFVLAELRGCWKWLGYLLLGLGLTAKQFGLPLLFPLALAHRRHWRLIALGLAVGGLVMLPWIVWSPNDFFDIVIGKHLGRPLQPQSITVGSFLLNEFDVQMPRGVGWALAAAAVLGISLITPRNSAATALGLGTALLAFCVFHTQGFPNYFYLVQYLWLLGFVGLLPKPIEERIQDVPARLAA